MTKFVFGNHSAVRVRQAERERIRKFYRDVLGRKIMREPGDKVLDVPDVHLYFQAPGGQVFRLVGNQRGPLKI